MKRLFVIMCILVLCSVARADYLGPLTTSEYVKCEVFSYDSAGVDPIAGESLFVVVYDPDGDSTFGEIIDTSNANVKGPYTRRYGAGRTALFYNYFRLVSAIDGDQGIGLYDVSFLVYEGVDSTTWLTGHHFTLVDTSLNNALSGAAADSGDIFAANKVTSVTGDIGGISAGGLTQDAYGDGGVTAWWNEGKTGYALTVQDWSTHSAADVWAVGTRTLTATQTFDNTGTWTGDVTGSVGSISGITFPTNFGDLAITLTNGYVTVGTNTDKTGYVLTVQDWSTHSAADVWAVGTRQLTGTQTFNNTGTWTGNVTGSVGSVTGDIGGISAGGLTQDAYGDGGVTAWWNEGKTGYALTVQDWSTHSAADVWAVGTRTLTATQTFDNTGTWTGDVTGSVGSVTGDIGGLSAGAVDDFYNEDTTSHNTAGSYGVTWKDPTFQQGSAGDPWATWLDFGDYAHDLPNDSAQAAWLLIQAGDSSQYVTSSELIDDFYNEDTTSHNTASSYGVTWKDPTFQQGAAGDPWLTALPGSYSSGQAGFILGTNLDVIVSTRSSHSAADVWTSGTRTLTGTQTFDNTGTWTGNLTGSVGSVTGDIGGLASGAIDDFYNEDTTSHNTAGSYGVTWKDPTFQQGAAGDPWLTALPGSYSSGQAGFILGTNVDALVSSRSSHSAADVWAVGTRQLTGTQTFNNTGTWTGSVTGSVGSVTAPVVAQDTLADGDSTASLSDTIYFVTSSELIDDFYNEDTTSHNTASSYGVTWKDPTFQQGSAGDPWLTALPGSYSSGQAGFILGTNVDALVSSRSSHSAADVWAVGTRSLTDKAGFSLSSSGLNGVVQASGHVLSWSDLDNASGSYSTANFEEAVYDSNAFRVWEEPNTAADHPPGNTTGAQLRAAQKAASMATGTINTANDSTATLIFDSGATYPDDYLRHRQIEVEVGTDTLVVQAINEFVGATDSISFAAGEKWSIVPAPGNVFQIFPATGVHVIDVHEPAVLQIVEIDTASINAGLGEMLKDTAAYHADISSLALEASLFDPADPADSTDIAESVQGGLETKGYTVARGNNLDSLDGAISGITATLPDTSAEDISYIANNQDDFKADVSGCGGIPGSNFDTLLVLSVTDSTILIGVKVTITPLGGGTPLKVDFTDPNGKIFYTADDGSYEILLSQQGVTFTVPETVTVAGNQTDTLFGIPLLPGTPPSGYVQIFTFYIEPGGDTIQPTTIRYQYVDSTGAVYADDVRLTLATGWVIEKGQLSEVINKTESDSTMFNFPLASNYDIFVDGVQDSTSWVLFEMFGKKKTTILTQIPKPGPFNPYAP